MRITISISVVCMIGLLSACTRDNSGNQPPMVRDIIIDSNACEIFFTYDANNRCTSITQCDTVETYIYSHDSVIDTKMEAGVLLYTNIYRINAAGLAAGYMTVGGDGSLAAYSVTYDAAGHRLAAIDTTHPNTADNFTLQNGDIVLEVSTSTVMTLGNYSVSTIFYNGTINRLGNVNYGLSFLGTSSANLKKADNFNNQQGQYTVNYTYTLNNVNAVASQVSTINGVVVDRRTFDYY